MAESDAVNRDVERQMRLEAEILLSHIEQYDIDMRNILGDVKRGEDRSATLKSFDEVWNKRVMDVKDFKQAMDRLETERAEGIKKLLKTNFQKLVEIGHKPIYVLLEEFEEKIYSSNQQILCNVRAHRDLRDKLLAQADDARVKAQAKLKQLIMKDPQTRGRSRSTSVNIVDGGSSEGLSKPRSPSAGSGCKNKPIIRSNSESSLCLHYPEKGLDECVAKLLEVYKDAVMCVFTGFYNKLHSLYEDLVNQSATFDVGYEDIMDITGIQKMIDRKLVRANNPATDISEERLPLPNGDQHARQDCHDIHVVWQQSLRILTDRLRHTYQLLCDSGHLWDAHMLRSAQAQKLTLAAVEDLITENDATELAAEIPLNIAIEQLRQGSELDKLNKQYEDVLVLLNNLAALYKKHLEEEVKQLERFMEALDVMTPVLLAEIQCFLDKYPRENEAKDTSPKTSGDPCVKLPRYFLQAELQDIALLNWKNGILESLEQNLRSLPEALDKQAKLWIEDRATVLKMRNTMKMLSHEIRAERIQKEILGRRRNELIYHEDRLASHVQAVNQLIEELVTNTSTFFNFESPGLYPVTYWLEDIQKKLDEYLRNDLKLISYQQRLSRLRRTFDMSLQEVMERYKEKLAYRVQEARVANVRFLSRLQLFTDGGNFSSTEATRVMTTLIKTGDMVEGSVSKLNEAVTRNQMALKQEASLKIQLVENVVNEALLEFRKARAGTMAQLGKSGKSTVKK